jgi:TPR repeat protein
MFTRENLQNLSREQVTQLSIDASNPASPNYWSSQLKFGLCQLYGIRVVKDVVKGFDTIFEVQVLGKEYSRQAHEILTTGNFSEDDLKRIFEHYNNQEIKNVRTLNILGFCYQYALGVAKNLVETFRLYRLIADQVYASKENKLADLEHHSSVPAVFSTTSTSNHSGILIQLQQDKDERLNQEHTTYAGNISTGMAPMLTQATAISSQAPNLMTLAIASAGKAYDLPVLVTEEQDVETKRDEERLKRRKTTLIGK